MDAETKKEITEGALTAYSVALRRGLCGIDLAAFMYMSGYKHCKTGNKPKDNFLELLKKLEEKNND